MVALRKEKVLCHVLFALFFFNFLFLGGHIFTLIVGTPSPPSSPCIKSVTWVTWEVPKILLERGDNPEMMGGGGGGGGWRRNGGVATFLLL